MGIFSHIYLVIPKIVLAFNLGMPNNESIAPNTARHTAWHAATDWDREIGMASKKKEAAQAPTDAIKVYKGFNADWTCRDYQFKVGETYVHSGAAKLCESGFHACEYPLDIFNYYPPTGQMAECELSGLDENREGDSKRAGKSITIKASISIPLLIAAAIEFTTSRCDPAAAKHTDEDQSASSATGDQSASSATGDQSASSATGNCCAAPTHSCRVHHHAGSHQLSS
jgi:hypothetical protein